MHISTYINAEISAYIQPIPIKERIAVDPDIFLGVKLTIFWTTRGVRFYFDLYASVFLKKIRLFLIVTF